LELLQRSSEFSPPSELTNGTIIVIRPSLNAGGVYLALQTGDGVAVVIILSALLGLLMSKNLTLPSCEAVIKLLSSV